MARLTSVASWLGNFGKSIGYSAKDILSEAAPNTSKIVEDASDEIYKFRDFMSDYKSKGKVVDKYLNFTELQKQANDIITGTISDIKTGNFAAPKDSFDDMFGGDDFDFGSDDYTDAEDQDEEGAEVRKLNLSTDAKATAKATIQGNTMIAETLEKASKAQMMAQVNTAKAIMNTTNNIGMIAINKLGASLTETNRRLDQINSNLVEMLKFMNENQSKVNQAQLDYLESAKEYMKIQLNMLDPGRKTKDKKKTALENFLSEGSFSLPSYIEAVKENAKKTSQWSQAESMYGMLSIYADMMGSMGGLSGMIRPTQMLMKMGLKKLLPKKVLQSITRVDDLLPKALMGGLSTLSDMKNQSGIKGVLGTIFGAGAEKRKGFQIGNYEKGAVPWDGRSKRALEVVIPHYLSLIESNTSNIPKSRRGHEASFYDYETGIFTRKSAIRDKLRRRTSDVFRGDTSDSVSLFEHKFADNEKLQERAKEIMWKHLQPMIFGEKVIEGEENVTKASKAYAEEIRKLGFNPYEVSQLVIYFKSSVTKLRQYMMQFQLSTDEQELFNEREVDDFGFVKGGFRAADLGNISIRTGLYEKQKKEEKKAKEADDELRSYMKKLTGPLFVSDKKKNQALQTLRYMSSEGIGTIHGRSEAASTVEAGGLTLVNYLSGLDEFKVSGGVSGIKQRFTKSVKDNKYDHLTVSDVMQIMRKNKYNPDQYDFITADNSGSKDGIFAFAVLRARYGKVGCLRVLKRDNIAWNNDSKKYYIRRLSNDELIVTQNDREKDFQPPEESDIYPISNTSLPRNGRDQKAIADKMMNDPKIGVLIKTPKDHRSFVQKAKDFKTQIITGTNPYDEKMQEYMEEVRKSREAKGKKGKMGNGPGERLGGSPNQKKIQQKKREERREEAESKARANTNEDSERKTRYRRSKKAQEASINQAVDELNKASAAIKDELASDDEEKSLWDKIKSKIGMTRRAVAGAGVGGLIGSIFLPGGPIGGAVIGAALGIATTGFDFKRFFFGSKHVDKDGTVHYEKTGIIGQWQNMLTTSGKEVVKTTFNSMKNEIVAYTKAQFAPVMAAFRSPDGKSLIPKTMVETIQDVGKNVIQAITHPMETLNNGIVRVSGALLSATIRAGASMVKTTAKAGTWLIAKPAQMIADTVAAARGGKNPFQFIRNLASAGIQRKKARIGAKAGYYFGKGGFRKSIVQGAKDAVHTRGGLIHRVGVLRQGIRKDKSRYYSGKYEVEKAKLDEIRENLKSDDPYTRQYAMEQLLPKDENGLVADPAWDQMKDKNGLIDPAALEQYMEQNANRFINYREQALAGISGEATYLKTKDESIRKSKFDRTLEKLSRKDAYQYNPNMSDREAKHRQKLIEKYVSRDEKGKINDELYLKIKRDKDGNLDKEDLDKFIKNRDAFAQEVAERERIEKEKADAERRKQEEKNERRNRAALQLSQLIATLGANLDSSLIDESKDNASAIISATVTAVKQKAENVNKQKEDEEREEKEKAEDAANEAQDQAVIARSKKDKEKRASAEVAAETKRKESIAREADETAKIQAQGQNKVEDNAEDEEDDTAVITDTGNVKEEEKESGIGDLLSKIGMAVGGIGLVGAFLSTDAGKKVVSTLAETLGTAIINLGSSLAKGIRNAIWDGIKNIGKECGDFLKSFLPGGDTKEFTVDEMNELNPDYVSSSTKVNEDGETVVEATVNNDRGVMIPNLLRRKAMQTTMMGDSYGKLASAGYKKAGQVVGAAGDVGLKIVDKGYKIGSAVSDAVGNAKNAFKATKVGKVVGGIGKGVGKAVDIVTDHIPVVKEIKGIGKAGATIGKVAGKMGAHAAKTGTSLAKRAAGALSKVTKKAADVTTSKWAATNGAKLWEDLTTMLDTLTEALNKFSQCKPLKQLLKDMGPEELIKKIKDYVTKIVTSAKSALKETSFVQKISEQITKFNQSLVGQAVKGAVVVVTAAWSAASGALDAANLFMVSEDDVDVGMRTVSAIMNLLVEFVPVVGPIFDLVSTISEMLGFPNFKRELAELMYEAIYHIFGLEKKGVKSIDLKQSEYEAEYQKYLDDNGLEEKDLSLVEYNDIVNQTTGSKLFNATIGKVGGWVSGLFGGDKNKKKQASSATVAEDETLGSGSDKKNQKQKLKEARKNQKESLKAAKEINKGKSLGNGSGSLGYGPGMTQDDPSYASVNLGKLPDGSTATMKNSGCGPTALANAVAAAGGDANPGEVGRYAKRNGMLTDGGANSKLFTEGARKYGMKGTEIGSMDSLNASLDSGNPVIVSGKSMGYGPGCDNGTCNPSSLYTKAGHIVTVTGRNEDGTYNVDDGEGESIVSGDMLQNGATKAFSMERLGGAISIGTTTDSGVDTKTTAKNNRQTAANKNVMQDNGTTIQHGSYYFAQNDPTWGGNTLSGYSGPIRNIGCVMTSAAMGSSTVLGQPINPGTFNTYGNGNVGSTNFGKLGLKVTRLPANGRQAIVSPSAPHLPQIVQALKQRKMVMMYGDKTSTNMYNDGNPNGSAHCVLATGLDKDGNIIVNNPWSADNKYKQVQSAGVAYPPVESSVDPFHWAQIIETTDGKGASTSLADPGLSASAAGSTSGGYTTAADGSVVGADGASESDTSGGNLFNAIFGAVGNIFNTVGSRLATSVMTGKSYSQVKAEEEAAAATGTDTTGTDTTLGSGTGSTKKNPKDTPLRAKGRQTDAMLKQKLSKKELEHVNFGPEEDIGHGPAAGTDPILSETGDKLDQMILLLTDIRTNTGNMVGSGGSALGGTSKSVEAGKNTIASKQGHKTSTQRKQSAKDTAKSKLSALNNGLKSESLSRSSLRATYAKIGGF